MDDDTSINVPVKVRTHELQQAHDFIPRVAQRLRDIDADPAQEQADELERIYAEHVEGVEATYPKGPEGADSRGSSASSPPEQGSGGEFAAYISMPADDWRAVVGGVARLRGEEGLRSWWFRKKLVKRLQARLEEME